MNVAQNEIEKLIAMPEYFFHIPVFQRRYAWKEEQCKQLINDLMEIVENGGEHFMGSVCLKMDSRTEPVIVDGQQRITTMMLVYLALYDILDPEEYEQDREAILNSCLMIRGNSRLKTKDRPKLIPVEVDRPYFEALFDEVVRDVQPSDEHSDSQYFKNFELIRSELKKALDSGVEYDKLRRAIQKLYIVEIDLDNENPQTIFESLNATGVNLMNVDLLRNYLFMPLTADEQEELYKDYWMKIEQNAQGYGLEDLFWYWFIFRRKTHSVMYGGKKTSLSKKNLYFFFKREFEKYQDGTTYEKTKKMFKDLLKVSFYFKEFMEISSPYSEADEDLYGISKIFSIRPYTILYFYLREILDDGKISKKEFIDAVHSLNTLSVRGSLCGNKTYLGGIQFSSLAVQKADNIDYNNFEHEFWTILSSGKKQFSIPTDKEFTESLSSVPLFSKFKSAAANYILREIERSLNPKENLSMDDISVEHIMPQTISSAWKSYLSEHNDLENYNKDSIHRIGNLTLTGYNSELSNKPFSKKKEVYEHSNFTMSRDLTQYEDWTSNEIEQRSMALSRQAIKTWQIPEWVIQKPQLEKKEFYDLNTDFGLLIGTKPRSLVIQDEEFKVVNWVNVYQHILEHLYNLDPELFNDLKETVFKNYWRSEKINLYSVRINNRTYFRNMRSTKDFLDFSKKAVDAFSTELEENIAEDIFFTVK